jgi:hypothetical protein
MLHLLLKQVRVDDYVIEVCNAKLVLVLVEHHIVVTLEGRMSVHKTEQNNGILVVALACMEHCLPLVLGRYPEPMVGPADVQLHIIVGNGKVIY